LRKLYFLVSEGWNSPSGVGKKIKNEILSFELKGYEVSRVNVAKTPKLSQLIPFCDTHYWGRIDLPKDSDVIFIRYEFCSWPFIRFLKKIKKNNLKSSIVLEIASYPYENELKKLRNPFRYWRDLYYSRFLKKYVDLVVSPSNIANIHGIETINIVNCINVDEIKSLPKEYVGNGKVINIIAVAQVAFYYGYDRLIKGIANYYRNVNNAEKHEICFHLVGEGPAISDLKNMCEMLKVSDKVVFHGFKTGEELDKVYELADVGIDVLGSHRKGEKTFGTLKSREYIAKGLPFVTEYELPDSIKPISSYILKVPDDESDILVDDIIRFVDIIRQESRQDIIESMRSFAYSYCDVSVAMNPVIEYLERKNN